MIRQTKVKRDRFVHFFIYNVTFMTMKSITCSLTSLTNVFNLRAVPTFDAVDDEPVGTGDVRHDLKHLACCCC